MPPLTSNEVRSRFLSYFERNGHTVVPSSSLIPEGDPTLFFTNAGMVQFKDTFTGKERRPYSRATSSQKVLRVSGKHNDLENVGRTARHHTFFEMLGNFSFGDYFKKDAIRFAWELLTGDLGLDPERLWVTVYEKDDEAHGLWSEVNGFDPRRIQRLGEKDNFWSMGDTGPCGPCSEIHYDHGEQFGPGGGPASESPRYVEIWNLVFMQFERSADGTMTPLPKPSIDTGAGLERVTAAIQKKYWNYDTDCFSPIIETAAALARVKYGQNEDADTALRVIADHARATAFLIADGLMPRNEEREYVLRRIMRRAIRFGVKIGLQDPFLYKATDAVVAHMGDAYPELVERRGFIAEVVRAEEERFAETRDKGLTLLEREFASMDKAGRKVVSGDVAFELYDTHGFPLDLTQLIAEERGYTVDEASYTTRMKEQRERSQASWEGSGETATAEVLHEIKSAGLTTRFSGYAGTSGTSTVTALLKGGARADRLSAGDKGSLLVEETPFYGEAGGQVGDLGQVKGPDGFVAKVLDTHKALGDLVLHQVEVQAGSVRVGDAVTLEVDASVRDLTRLNHTATHLLHAALRTVLGEHVTQKGSLVGPHRLRFDFAHHKPMTPEEIDAVEDLVYREILKNTALEVEETTLDSAKKMGAMALFGEKYGNNVRVVKVPGFSTELCGGTHARRTGDIALFRIVSESGIAAGVRRIEALTGPDAFQWSRTRDHVARDLALAARRPVEEIPTYVRDLEDDKRQLSRKLQELESKLRRLEAGDLSSQARSIGSFKMLAAELAGPAASLREEADRLRDQLGSSVVVLGTRADGQVSIVATVSKDLAGKSVHAGKLVKDLAAMLGGNGGGRPDMAQGGGKNADALPAALEKAYEIVAGAA
jgi:alanyl-tRNA synthetase